MLSKNAKDLLLKRYCRNNEQPTDVFKRVSTALSLGDDKFSKRLLKLMNKGIFLPNSPCLRNAGNKKALLHACFVLPVEDTMESLTDSLKQMMIIFKHGGGIGMNFSKLRPKDATLNSGGTSSGVVSFMKLYDVATETVKQGGFRRGALMGVLNFEHDEIMRFISSKLTGDLTNFNISVLVSDKFMEDIVNDKKIELKNPQDNSTTGVIGAKTIFDVIAHAAWHNGDPGLLFYDRINKDNILFPKVKIKTTNPCITGDSYVLTVDGQIKIKDMVNKRYKIYCLNSANQLTTSWAYNIKLTRKNVKIILIKTTGGTIKCTHEHLINTVNRGWVEAQNIKKEDVLYGVCGTRKKIVKCVNILDIQYQDKKENVYDLSVMDSGHNFFVTSDLSYKDYKSVKFDGVCIHNCGEVPLPDYGACCLGSINISQLIKYNKFDFKEFEDVLKIAVRALRNMNAISWYPLPEITKVMKELDPIGVGIMGFADTLIKLNIKYDSEECLKFIDEVGVVYKKVTDKLAKDCFWKRIIAPTGSLSILADCSSGIEPIFDTVFERHLTIGTIKEKRDLYKSPFTRIAHDIEPIWHLKIQAQWQKWCDGSISKTINLPYEASVDDIKEIYLNAWKMGCKGITIFRDGSKEGVLKRVKKPKCSDETCSL
jgi:ribonucleoside-diphosphate reductase alpha chain